MREIPRYWLGAVGGAVGALPLLALSARLAERFATPPVLPGLERMYHDVKEVTYAEAAVFLLAVPAAAFLFAVLLPRWLGRLAPRGRLSLEWPAAGFACSWFLVRHGVRAKHSFAIAIALAAAIAAAVVAFRRRARVRRLFAGRVRGAWVLLAAAAAALSIAAWSRAARLPATGADSAARVGLSTAVLLLAAGAWLASSRRPDAALLRLRMPLALVVLASAVALALRQPRPFLLAATALAAMAAAARAPGARRGGAVLRAALAAFAVVCAWRLLVPASPWLDSFEEGQSLFPAQLYLSGATPYVGAVPVHGWGADGGVDAFCMRAFGATLETFQARRGLWSVLALLGLGAACFAAFRSAAWGGLALLLALSVASGYVIERQLLAFASLACLVAAARRGSRWWLAAAGALAGVEIFHSLDYGLVLLVGGGAAAAALAIARGADGRRLAGIGHVAAFVAAALAAAVPLVLRLASVGSLGAFARESFVTAPRWVAEAWGRPAGSAWDRLSGAADSLAAAAQVGDPGIPWLFFLAVLGAAGAAMLVRAGARGLDEDDRAALAGLLVAMVAMRVVLGRADAAHLQRYAIFTAIPAAWLLLRAWRSRAGLALFVLAAMLLSLRLHPLAQLEKLVARIVYSGAANAEPSAHPPRAGRATMPVVHAGGFSAFRRFADSALRPGETFFDFDNQPALYFLADRRPPIRYATVAQYETAERQREVIEALERARPGFVILPSGLYGALDIPNAERAPEVWRWIDERYGQPCALGGWILARRLRLRLDGPRPEARGGETPPCVLPPP